MRVTVVQITAEVFSDPGWMLLGRRTQSLDECQTTTTLQLFQRVSIASALAASMLAARTSRNRLGASMFARSSARVLRAVRPNTLLVGPMSGILQPAPVTSFEPDLVLALATVHLIERLVGARYDVKRVKTHYGRAMSPCTGLISCPQIQTDIDDHLGIQTMGRQAFFGKMGKRGVVSVWRGRRYAPYWRPRRRSALRQCETRH